MEINANHFVDVLEKNVKIFLFTEYLCIFLSLSSTHICSNYTAEPPQTPIFLAVITGEGMKDTREIAG